jgi:membrane protein
MMNYIYTLIPIALIGFAAVQGSKWNFNAATYMDKKYTNAVKGMMCVVIMYVHISNDYTNTVQNIIGSFAYVGVFTFFAISAFGCRTSVERSQSYLNQFWKKRILALFVPAILINMISFGFKVMSLNVYEVRGLYAFNQYIYAIIVAYLVFWIIWKTKAIPVDIKDWLVGLICLLFSLITYLTPIKIFFIWPTESIGFIFGLILYHKKEIITSELKQSHTRKMIILFLLSALLGILYMKYKHVFFLGGWLLRVVLAVVLLLLFSACTMNISFEGRLVQLLGNISYEFYLGHLVVISIVSRLFPKISSGFFIVIVFIATLILSIVVKIMSDKIMSPLLRTRKTAGRA